MRINIEYDHATHVVWSPDSRAYIVHKAADNCIEVYKVDKRRNGLPFSTIKAITFDKVHTETTVGFGISCNGRFMMSCSSQNDLVVWSLRGEQLAQVDTYLMTTTMAKISPCARFIVASGFVSDVKIWEVLFDKEGKFKQVVRAFELTGHTSGVYDFAFDAGTSHIATVSKDGTWRLFNTKIDYTRGEMVQLVSSGSYSQDSSSSHIALSSLATTVIVATGPTMEIFNAATGKLCYTIDNIFSDNITGIQYDPLGKYIFVAGENRIRVFDNVAINDIVLNDKYT